LRTVVVFLSGAVAGALLGSVAGTALTRSMMAATRQQNPQYTGEGLEYVAIAATFAGTALGAVLAMVYLAARARRTRRQRANQPS
jgi:uncharacterized integral membrane protein